MPAKSTAQRHLMGMALALKKGKMKADDIPYRVREKVKKLAADEDIDLEGFASTPEAKLPKHVGSNRSGIGRGGRVRYA